MANVSAASGVAASPAKKSERTETHNGIVYKNGSYQSGKLDYDRYGTIYSGILAKDQKVNGVLFKAGTGIEVRNSSGGSTITIGTVAKKTTISNMIIEAGTNIIILDGSVARGTGILETDKVILEIKFKGRTKIALYHNGLDGILAEDHEINGVKYTGGKRFFGRGHLAFHATLALSYNPNWWQENMVVGGTLASDYGLLNGKLVDKNTEKCLTLIAGTQVVFYDGSLHIAVIPKDQEINGKLYKAGTELRFDDASNITDERANGTIDGHF